MTKFSISLLLTDTAIIRSLLLCLAICGGLSGPCLADGQRTDAAIKWVVPARQAQERNPVAPDESSLVAGRKIYLERCTACHGQTGDGDGDDAIAFGFHAARLSNPRLRDEPDGALYWRITTGKRPMPEYGTRLSATDRWNVVNYIRTLSQGKERE